jgi:hypothetical protein
VDIPASPPPTTAIVRGCWLLDTAAAAAAAAEDVDRCADNKEEENGDRCFRISMILEEDEEARAPVRSPPPKRASLICLLLADVRVAGQPAEPNAAEGDFLPVEEAS